MKNVFCSRWFIWERSVFQISSFSQFPWSIKHTTMNNLHVCRRVESFSVSCLHKTALTEVLNPFTLYGKYQDLILSWEIVITVWSVSGGNTMVFSIVFITSFQSSFSTRFKTVFSQILANSVRLTWKQSEARWEEWRREISRKTSIYISVLLAVKEVHDGLQDVVSILCHAAAGARWHVSCSFHLAKYVAHLLNVFFNVWLETKREPSRTQMLYK